MNQPTQPDAAGTEPIAGSNLWLQPREIEEVRRLLVPGETLLLLTNGRVLRRMIPSRTWLIALTQHRLVCLRGHRTTRRRLIEVRTSAIDAAYIKRDIGGRELRIEAESGKLRLGRIPPETADALVRMIIGLRHQQGLNQPVRATPQVAPVRAPADDRMEFLEATVERLESELAEVREHIEFLELLLQKRGPSVEQVSSQHTGDGYAS